MFTKPRFIMFVFVLGMLLSDTAHSDMSAVKTGDAICATGAVFLRGILVMTDGTNAVTVKIYGNTAASGTSLIPDWVVTTSATDMAQGIFFPPKLIPSYAGIYVDVTVGGGGALSYIVYYDNQ